MATYKRRGYKKSITSSKEDNLVEESKTAEVFEKLDDTASKTEKWVSKYQNIILGFIYMFSKKIPTTLYKLSNKFYHSSNQIIL